jgi:hypothetical protein
VSSPLAEVPQGFVTSFLAGGGPDGMHAIFTLAQRVGLTNDSFVVADTGFYDSDVANEPLQLVATNGGAGNFNGGNAGNSMKVTVLYTIIDV